MRLVDLYFQAFRAFRKHTKDDSKSQKLRKVIAHSNHKDGILTTIKYECDIEVDWIENIEEGLKFVEKAILEDHQFIRTEGEVVPIEKVKNVSKASVEHLSRHSNFITRIPKDPNANLIPDKLYVVEKLSDYLVYENRFIFLLLCYVRDFVQMRLNNIKDKTTTYQSDMSINKNIEANQRNIQYKLNVTDLSKNDPYLLEQFSEIPRVNRVETIYAIAVSLLATPLMKEVAKAPLLKPPVIKTNVLRMNQNFKAALKLYDYITSYNTDGYELRQTKQTFQPIPPEMEDEIAETIELTSVISYIVGNDIKDSLEQSIKIKETEQLEAQNKKTVEEIKRLKKRIVEMDENPTEYIFKLEKRNIQLEKDNRNLAQERDKNSELEVKIVRLESDKVELEESIDTLNLNVLEKENEIDAINQKYFDDMTQTESIHQDELQKMEQLHYANLRELKESHRLFMKQMNEEFITEKQNLESILEAKLKSLIVKHTGEVTLLARKSNAKEVAFLEYVKELINDIEKLKTEAVIFETKILAFETDVMRLEDERNHANGQYLALKTQQGLLTEEDNFTSRDKFKQLELEMKAYKKLFKEQWKLTKQSIRENARKES